MLKGRVIKRFNKFIYFARNKIARITKLFFQFAELIQATKTLIAVSLMLNQTLINESLINHNRHAI